MRCTTALYHEGWATVICVHIDVADKDFYFYIIYLIHITLFIKCQFFYNVLISFFLNFASHFELLLYRGSWRLEIFKFTNNQARYNYL